MNAADAAVSRVPAAADVSGLTDELLGLFPQVAEVERGTLERIVTSSLARRLDDVWLAGYARGVEDERRTEIFASDEGYKPEPGRQSPFRKLLPEER